MGMKPLEGVKVVELSTYVAAPGAARILADFGADVIKIESFSGDQWRESGKKMLKTTDEENPIFDVYNTGKKSVSVNIKTEKGLEVVFRLLETADVFITNMRVKSLQKLGLDAKSLSERFPKLVYAGIDGFGPKGPDANNPGFDNISFWARSGFCLDMPYKTENTYPMPPTSGIGDCVTGGFLVAGIMMALFNRERIGKGEVVNVSLYGAAIWSMSSMLLRANPKYGGTFPMTPNQGDPLTNNYECSDGKWCNISVRAYDKDAALMYEKLGISEDVKKLGDVNVNNYCDMSEELIPLIRRAMKKQSSEYWINEFRKDDLVIGILPHMTDVLVDEQAWANGFLEKLVNRNEETSIMSCPPIHLASYEKPLSVPAPHLGENTVGILEELGYTPEEIQDMGKEGAIKKLSC